MILKITLSVVWNLRIWESEVMKAWEAYKTVRYFQENWWPLTWVRRRSACQAMATSELPSSALSSTTAPGRETCRRSLRRSTGSFWHHKEQLWSKSFFLLEKVKIIPHKGEKFFFAFLDELGHSKHKIKSVIITPNPPPP